MTIPYQHLQKVFCFCSGIDAHIQHQSRFMSGTQNLSASSAVGWKDIPVVFILAFNLQTSGNRTQGWTRLAEVHTSLPDIFWFFPWRSTFLACLKIHPLICVQNVIRWTYQKLPKAWHHQKRKIIWCEPPLATQWHKHLFFLTISVIKSSTLNLGL